MSGLDFMSVQSQKNLQILRPNNDTKWSRASKRNTQEKNIYQITCNIFDLDIKVLKRTIKTAHKMNTQMTYNGVNYLSLQKTFDKYI